MDDALESAAAWFALLQASDASPADHARWQRWIRAAPSHQTAWQKIEAVNRQFGMLPASPALAALTAPPPRRAAAKKLLALTGAVALGTLASRDDSRDYVAALAAGERTAVGEVRQLALADGSTVWMNTDSALDLDFAGTQRRVVLHRGEILLHSYHGAAASQPAPMVDVGGARLTARNTRFSVYRTDASVLLSVFQGAVWVDRGAGMAAHVAGAGMRLRFGERWTDAPHPVDETQQAWTRNRLSVERMRLDQFVATLARYRHGHLGCNPAIANLLLTGSYPLDDIERVLAALEKTLPIRVRHILPLWTTIEPA